MIGRSEKWVRLNVLILNEVMFHSFDKKAAVVRSFHFSFFLSFYFWLFVFLLFLFCFLFVRMSKKKKRNSLSARSIHNRALSVHLVPLRYCPDTNTRIPFFRRNLKEKEKVKKENRKKQIKQNEIYIFSQVKLIRNDNFGCRRSYKKITRENGNMQNGWYITLCL